MKTITGFYLTMNNKVCSPLFLRSKLGEAFDSLLEQSLMSQAYIGVIVFPIKGTDEDAERQYMDNFRG